MNQGTSLPSQDISSANYKIYTTSLLPDFKTTNVNIFNPITPTTITLRIQRQFLQHLSRIFVPLGLSYLSLLFSLLLSLLLSFCLPLSLSLSPALSLSLLSLSLSFSLSFSLSLSLYFCSFMSPCSYHATHKRKHACGAGRKKRNGGTGTCNQKNAAPN